MTLRSGLVALLAALLAVPAGAQPVAPSAVSPRWTIRSDDCVSVDADGEPWEECGFQSFAMNEEGSRVLTVSTRGVVQLWDVADGREIRRIDWPDEPGGASGFPDGRAIFVGGNAVAIVHQNQLLLLDPADGRERGRTVLDIMMVWTAKRLGDRLFVDYRDRNWDTHAGEIDLAAGAVHAVPGLTDLNRMGPAYWVEGTQPPFIIHTPGRAPAQTVSERSCMPFDARFCVWRDIPGPALHLFDVGAGRWQSFDLGQVYDGYTSIDPVLAGTRPYALICGRGSGPLGQRPCALRDLAGGRDLYRFNALHARAVGAVDGEGRPEVRIAFATDFGNHGETVRVAADGNVRRIAQSLLPGTLVRGGGMLLPDWSPETSLLVDAAGRTVARLPFPPGSCGFAPATGFGCPATPDGRHWLVPLQRHPRPDSQDNRLDLALFALPAP